MKIKQNLWLSNPDHFLRGQYDYCFAMTETDAMDRQGWVLCGEIELDVNVDSGEVIKTVTAAIDAEILKTQGELEGKINILKTRKNELLALTHQVAA